MKIAKLTIENFKQFEKLELDFTDSLGRVRDITAIIGPNTSGKTTILDAIAAGVGVATEIRQLRPDFQITPWSVVKRGAIEARITSIVRFSTDEINAIKRLYDLAKEKTVVPTANEVRITWTYPHKNYKLGFHNCDPRDGRSLFKGRSLAARLLATGRVDISCFQKTGGVFTFDQQRTGMGKTIRNDIWEIISGSKSDFSEISESRYTKDPRTILLALAVQDLVPAAKEEIISPFSLIKNKYNQVCSPHQIVGAVRNELGDLDLRFQKNGDEYNYEGLSSGEQMMLLFLIKMVTEHINRSIVLIDEIELHQHPIWQRKLLDILPQVGIENQFIVTTHSPYIRDIFPDESIINLGYLEEASLGETK